MWDAIINLVEKKWAERPKKELIYSLIQLRRDMKECQDWYNQFRQQKINDDDGFLYSKKMWLEVLYRLPDSIMGIDEVMEIFSPETHKKIDYYSEMESLAAKFSFEDLENETGLKKGFDFETGSIDPIFFEALEHLDEFIRTNFKPEEIIAASKFI